MELAEVYRVTYEGPDVKLRGIIVCKDEENGYQYLFKDQDIEDDDDDIEDDDIEDDDDDNTKTYEEAEKQSEGTSKPLFFINEKAESGGSFIKGRAEYQRGAPSTLGRAEYQRGAPSKPLIRPLGRGGAPILPLIGRAEYQLGAPSKPLIERAEYQRGAPSKPLIGRAEYQRGAPSKPGSFITYEKVEKQFGAASKLSIRSLDHNIIIVKNLKDDDINNTMLKYDTFQGYKDADKRQDLDSKQLIKSLDHIIPNAPIKSSIRAKDGFLISFYLFGSVYENITFKYPSSRPEKLNVPRIKYIQSEDGFRYLQVFYAIFGNAVEARVKVTLTNNSGLFNLYGVIAARTSAIRYRAYSSLIFCKRRGRGQKIKVYRGRGKVIPLSRDVVAVPLGHQLILEFGLYGCDNDERVEEDNDEMLEEDNDRIVKKTLMFDATKEGTSTAYIHCSKGTFEVVVSWCSTRKPVEAQAQAN